MKNASPLSLEELLARLPDYYTPADRELIQRAYRVAEKAHSGQKRVSGEPYINHLLAVAAILAEYSMPAEVVTAGLLHDTIEDTATTPEEIRARFGEQVLTLVLEVTDDKTLPKPERKRLQIERASHSSPAAKLIKLVDKICNLGDILHSPASDWSLQRRQEYLLWTEQVVAGLRGTNPALEKQYDETLEAGIQILEIK